MGGKSGSGSGGGSYTGSGDGALSSDPRFLNSATNPDHPTYGGGAGGSTGSTKRPSSQDGESKGYEGGKPTKAAIQSLQDSMVSMAKGMVTGGPVVGAARFMGTSAFNASDVATADRLGISLDDARLADKHGILQELQSLLDEDDDDDSGNGSSGTLGSDSEMGSDGSAGNGGLGRGGSEGTWA